MEQSNTGRVGSPQSVVLIIADDVLSNDHRLCQRCHRNGKSQKFHVILCVSLYAYIYMCLQIRAQLSRWYGVLLDVVFWNFYTIDLSGREWGSDTKWDQLLGQNWRVNKYCVVYSKANTYSLVSHFIIIILYIIIIIEFNSQFIRFITNVLFDRQVVNSFNINKILTVIMIFLHI